MTSTLNRRLAAARRLVTRLSPPTPGAWLSLPQEEFDRRREALRIARCAVDELTLPSRALRAGRGGL